MGNNRNITQFGPPPSAEDKKRQEALVARFAARCREAGLVDTAQRRVIYGCLTESLDHPTAEVVHDRVRTRLPRVSLATVYRNLKLFSEAGLIDEVATGASFARYDANREGHHHLICKSCGAVSDSYADPFEMEGWPGELVNGFAVHDVKITAYGICAECGASDGKAGH